eukprot:27410-Pelagococcus_subviridis.AAC.4
MVSAPASVRPPPFFAAADRAPAMPYDVLNSRSVPRKPGMRKSNRLQSSTTSFWIGVPERSNRCSARIFFTACVIRAFGFRIAWPSSRMQYENDLFVVRYSTSCRNASYDMITTSYSPDSMSGRSAARSLGDPAYSSGFKTSSETYRPISCAQ